MPIADTDIISLSGEVLNTEDAQRSMVLGVMRSFPLMGIILGSLLTFIPYRRLKYSQKFPRFTLVTLLVINAILMIFTLMKHLRITF